jgi:AAA15 family ATPase/GTPase
MKLVAVEVSNFRSIHKSGIVEVDPTVTVLVGQNESGKTAFLSALDLSHPVQQKPSFSLEKDYPRISVNEYRRRHDKSPDNVTVLTYELDSGEIERINEDLGFNLFQALRFSVTHTYKPGSTISLIVDETEFVEHSIRESPLPAELKNGCASKKTLRDLIAYLTASDLNTEGKEYLESMIQEFNPEATKWPSLLEYWLWSGYLDGWRPKFFYFDDYYLIPGKINLNSLAQLQPSNQKLGHKAALALLALADTKVADLVKRKSYEELKSRLEGLSNSITDTIFKFWTQNQELDVEFDIQEDPSDEAPFNSGPNLYVRIKNKRHRVSVPFSQRSKGFIWFFSFIVWFDSIKQQIGEEDLILLLDEPGLSLHALAQSDFLRYIDHLAEKHQIIYTTHSPFMINSDRLHQVRVVEDKKPGGTVVSSNLGNTDSKTIFPLQAALGYTIAQNLFIAKRNVLVEGPADLLYLKWFSDKAEKEGRVGLREDVTIVPTGGLDKVATFIALLGANDLELSVLHDWTGSPDQRIAELIRERLITERRLMHFGQFVAEEKTNNYPAADIEDLFAIGTYLQLFNSAFEKKLAGKSVKEADLPNGDRIVDRINRWLIKNEITLRKSGGFNHYIVANHLTTNPPKSMDKTSTKRFDRVIEAINKQFTAKD